MKWFQLTSSSSSLTVLFVRSHSRVSCASPPRHTKSPIITLISDPIMFPQFSEYLSECDMKQDEKVERFYAIISTRKTTVWNFPNAFFGHHSILPIQRLSPFWFESSSMPFAHVPDFFCHILQFLIRLGIKIYLPIYPSKFFRRNSNLHSFLLSHLNSTLQIWSIFKNLKVPCHWASPGSAGGSATTTTSSPSVPTTMTRRFDFKVCQLQS